MATRWCLSRMVQSGPFWTAKAAVLLQNAGVPHKVHIASTNDHAAKPFALCYVKADNLAPIMGDPDIDLLPDLTLDAVMNPKATRDAVVATAANRGMSIALTQTSLMRNALDQIAKTNLGLAGFNPDTIEAT